MLRSNEGLMLATLKVGCSLLESGHVSLLDFGDVAMVDSGHVAMADSGRVSMLASDHLPIARLKSPALA